MKKIILAVLMAVMITTPCFAQEVEPEGLFSIEGTSWLIVYFRDVYLKYYFGFYEGDVYLIEIGDSIVCSCER
jgi:hypothetical protein